MQGINAFLVLWFLLLRKSQAHSWFYGLIVAQVTSVFLFLWFDCGATDKRVRGLIV